MNPLSLRLAMPDGAVVLLRAVDVVRRTSVGDHVVELRGRLVILAAPGFSSVESHRHSAVVRAIMRRGFLGSIQRP